MTALLDVQHVSVTYPPMTSGGIPIVAVCDVSFQLTAGRIVGLAGQNGAGKTTLLEVCVGALRPTSGSVHWFDSSVRSHAVQRRVGFCPDVPAFAARLTVVEQLRLFAAFDAVPGDVTTRIEWVANRLRLTEFLDRRVESLSRGTAQRLGVAQALLHPRDVLICDETFAPLDPLAQVDLREVLRDEARRGAAVLVSSHQLDQLAKLADEVLVMRRGVLVQRETAESIAASRVLVLRADALSADAIAAAAARIPGGWMRDGRLMVPWAHPDATIEGLRARYPWLESSFALEREEASDLEQRFLLLAGRG